MNDTIECLVLARHKHNDRTDIVNVYGASRGFFSVAVPVSATAAGRRRRAMLLPLSQIELTVRGKGFGELLRPSQMNVVCRHSTLYSDPYKIPVVFFLSEFLTRVLHDSPADEGVWEYICRSLASFDKMTGRAAASFHLVFLSSLTAVLGIQPDITLSGEKDVYFDMRSGVYARGLPMHGDILTGQEARLPALLARLRYDSASRWRISGTQRTALLEGILRYYAIHYPGVERLKSIDVLKDLFK